ncbi:Cof-type HAD-IIB family hydrolase [Mycoplasmatota bacterium]|nr:Cof-type HAD-IIB family hydrolase [Mycoplasmatota bacterium]
MEKHLILIDLDGTLLNSKSQVSEMNKIILGEVQKQGHEIIITTGRAYYRSHMFYDELNLRSLIVNRNASIIHGPYDNQFKHIYEWIDPDTVENILTCEIAHFMRKMYIEHLNEVYVVKGERDFYEPYPLCKLIDYNNQALFNCTNLLSISVEKKDVEKTKTILERYSMVKYEKYSMGEELTLFNVYPIQSDKANAFSYLSDYYGVPQHRIIAFGDGGNDVRMIKEAGIGIAMKNAIDVVKKNAQLITDYSNNESGVGLFLKKYFELNI